MAPDRKTHCIIVEDEMKTQLPFEWKNAESYSADHLRIVDVDFYIYKISHTPTHFQ